MENAAQHILHASVELTPSPLLCQATDAFGNALLYGTLREPHDRFVVRSAGVADVMPLPLPDAVPAPYYWYATSLTRWDASLLTMCCGRSPEDIMHLIHARMRYRRFVTQNTTSALEAWSLAEGVCQDYAHIMTAACRAAGHAARYVNGLMVGEGETHAWVEVWEDGFWHSYDPTHDRRAGEGYVKIAHGRDASDCPVNRGRFFQWTSEIMKIKCIVSNDTDSNLS